jgi:O-antigen ligase
MNHRLHSLEVLALAGLLFFLPLLEAPKNICWLAFVLLWLGRAAFAGAGWGGRWQHGRDLPLAALLAAASLTCLFAAPFPSQWGEIGDVLRYVLLGALLARSQTSDRQENLLLGSTLLGTLLAAGIGWWQWKISGVKGVLELHSVGHVNHSAIYLAMVALGTLAMLLTRSRAWPLWQRAGLTLALLAQSWLLLTGESRGALLAFVGAAAVLALLTVRRGRAWVLAGLIGTVLAVLAWQPYLIDKTLTQWREQQTTTSSYRVELARTALTALRAHPVTGIGPGNFRLATPEQTSAWLAAEGASYEPARYYHAGHSHSLYFNTLAERGLLGAAALLLLAAIWLRRLWQAPAALSPAAAGRWGIGLAGFAGVFAAGLFNTSLHHEHGLLAMFAFGLLLAPPSLPSRNPS